jgi:hypothetical protein
VILSITVLFLGPILAQNGPESISAPVTSTRTHSTAGTTRPGACQRRCRTDNITDWRIFNIERSTDSPDRYIAVIGAGILPHLLFFFRFAQYSQRGEVHWVVLAIAALVGGLVIARTSRTCWRPSV